METVKWGPICYKMKGGGLILPKIKVQDLQVATVQIGWGILLQI